MAENREQAIEELDQGTLAVVRVLRYFFAALAAFMVFCIVFYFVSGIFILETGKHAIVMRFGKIVRVVEEPDWYFAWPKPIEQVEKIEVEKVHSFTSKHFWYKEQEANVMSGGPPPPPEEGPIRVGDGGYLLTAGSNIVHTKWSVKYKVADAELYYKQYRFGTDDSDKAYMRDTAEQAIRLALHNAVLKTVAQTRVDDVIKSTDNRVLKGTRKLLRKNVAEMAIGVEILELGLVGKQVPQVAKKAYEEVTNANNAKDEEIKKAIGYANIQAEEAKSASKRITEEAEVYKRKIRETAVADAAYLKRVQKEYRASGPSILLPQYVDVLTQLVAQSEHISIVYPDQELRVTLEPRPESRKKTDAKKPGTDEHGH